MKCMHEYSSDDHLIFLIDDSEIIISWGYLECQMKKKKLAICLNSYPLFNLSQIYIFTLGYRS